MNQDSDYEAYVRCVVSLRLSQGSGRATVSTLLSPGDSPYYPDGYEAARDWLAFATYHGQSDGRNDQVCFLLPETRAAIESSDFPEPGVLEVTVTGTDIEKRSLSIKGAYWKNKTIKQIFAQVENSKARLRLPEDSERLEYFLMDESGLVYDFYQQGQFSRSRRKDEQAVSGDQGVVQQIWAACRKGEGLQVEFKPFVDPVGGLTVKDERSGKDRKTPLKQVIETVAGFSNAEGGQIYLGIDDNCSIRGVTADLQRWGRENPSQTEESGAGLLGRYTGTLLNKIKGLMRGEVSVSVNSATIDEKIVVVISVRAASNGPIGMEDVQYELYVRVGASNRRTPLEHWRSAPVIAERSGRGSLPAWPDTSQL